MFLGEGIIRILYSEIEELNMQSGTYKTHFGYLYNDTWNTEAMPSPPTHSTGPIHRRIDLRCKGKCLWNLCPRPCRDYEAQVLGPFWESWMRCPAAQAVSGNPCKVEAYTT